MKKRFFVIFAMLLCTLLASAALIACNSDQPTGGGEDGPVIDLTEEFYVESVEMKSPPTKLKYGIGEKFDKTGLEIEVKWNDGYVETIDGSNAGVTAKPAIIAEDTEEIELYFGGFKVGKVELLGIVRPSDIAVTVSPSRTTYIVGESFKPNGMVVSTVDTEGTPLAEVTDYTFDQRPLTAADTSVTLSYVNPKNDEDIWTTEVPVTVTTGIIVEAENGKVTGGEKVTKNSGVIQYASGNAFVRNFSKGGTLIFDITANKDCAADLIVIGASACVALYNSGRPVEIIEMRANLLFSAFVNDVEVEIPNSCVFAAAVDETGIGSTAMFAQWADVQLDAIELKAGYNEIKFVFKDSPYTNNDSSQTSASAFYDQIMIMSSGAKLSEGKNKVVTGLTASTTKTDYYIGEDLDAAAISVTASYPEETSAPVELSDCEVTGYDKNVAGTQTVTIAYGDFSDEIEVTVHGYKSLSASSSKLKYYVGDTFDKSTITVELTYDNDHTVAVDIDDCTVTGYDVSTACSSTVTVEYAGITDTFDITTYAMTGISASTTKTNYNLDDALDIATVTVLSVWGDGSTKPVNAADCTYSDYDMSIADTYTVKVEYAGFEDTFDITVLNITLSSISVSNTKSTYKYGDELDLTAISVTATYSDNSTVSISAGVCEITGYDNKLVGPQTVTVTYGGQPDYFTITLIGVQSFTATSTKTEFSLNDTDFESGLNVTVTFTDTTTAALSADDYTVTGYDMTVADDYTVTVTWLDKTATINIKVVDPTVATEIVVTPPVRTAYFSGETLDLTGIVVKTVNYFGTVLETVSGYTCTLTGALAATDTTAGISYGGLNGSFDICVCDPKNGLEFEAEAGARNGGGLAESGSVVPYASHRAFVKDFANGNTLAFNVISTAATDGYLLMYAAPTYTLEFTGSTPKKTGDEQANRLFTFTVNGNGVTIPDSAIFYGCEFETATYEAYAHWTAIQLPISLIAGNNNITFTFKDNPYTNVNSTVASLFIDKLAIVSSGTTSLVQGNTELDVAAMLSSPTNTGEIQFEHAILASGAGTKTGNGTGYATSGQGSKYNNQAFLKNVGKLGTSISFLVYSSTARTADIIVRASSTGNNTWKMSTYFDLKVNGVAVSIDSLVLPVNNDFHPTNVTLTGVSLNAGWNTVVFTGISYTEGAFLDSIFISAA